jgi:hypothetical protein
MTTAIIDQRHLANPALDQFKAAIPYPWINFHAFLKPETFIELYQAFPSFDLFERHQDRPRKDGQRPHNRYYLAYETSIYKKTNQQDTGVVQLDELPEVWQRFLEELEGHEYRNFIACMLGVAAFEVRYAWHLGVTNSEVSPHLDNKKKLGTHIFYFNTDDDWDTAWGGEILVLEDKQTEANNPDFDEFANVQAVPLLNNQSFLFKNAANGWHGVKSLTCPEGHYRRLFNVIIEQPHARDRSVTPSLQRLATKWFSGSRA